MGIDYVEGSGKAFKAKLNKSEKVVADYLEQFNREEELLEFAFCKCHGSDEEYVIWCIQYDFEKSHQVYRGSDYPSYIDDILEIAYASKKNGTLLQIKWKRCWDTKMEARLGHQNEVARDL